MVLIIKVLNYNLNTLVDLKHECAGQTGFCRAINLVRQHDMQCSANTVAGYRNFEMYIL
jgi:hypothetical protein